MNHLQEMIPQTGDVLFRFMNQESTAESQQSGNPSDVGEIPKSAGCNLSL